MSAAGQGAAQPGAESAAPSNGTLTQPKADAASSTAKSGVAATSTPPPPAEKPPSPRMPAPGSAPAQASSTPASTGTVTQTVSNVNANANTQTSSAGQGPASRSLTPAQQQVLQRQQQQQQQQRQQQAQAQSQSQQPGSWRSLLDRSRSGALTNYNRAGYGIQTAQATGENKTSSASPASPSTAAGNTSASTTQARPAASGTYGQARAPPNLPGDLGTIPAPTSAQSQPPQQSAYGASFGPRRPFEGWGRPAVASFSNSPSSASPRTAPVPNTAATGTQSQSTSASQQHQSVAGRQSPASPKAASAMAAGARPGQPASATNTPTTANTPNTTAGAAGAAARPKPVSPQRSPVLQTSRPASSGIGSGYGVMGMGGMGLMGMYGLTFAERLALQQREREREIQRAREIQAKYTREALNHGANKTSTNPAVASANSATPSSATQTLAGSPAAGPADRLARPPSAPSTSGNAVKTMSASPTVPAATVSGPSSSAPNQQNAPQHRRPHSLSHSASDRERLMANSHNSWMGGAAASILAKRESPSQQRPGQTGTPQNPSTAAPAVESRTAATSQSPFGSALGGNHTGPSPASATGHSRQASLPGGASTSATSAHSAQTAAKPQQQSIHQLTRPPATAPIRSSFPAPGKLASTTASGSTLAAPASATLPSTGATVSRTGGTGLGLPSAGGLVSNAAAIEKDRERESQAANLANSWRYSPMGTQYSPAHYAPKSVGDPTAPTPKLQSANNIPPIPPYNGDRRTGQVSAAGSGTQATTDAENSLAQAKDAVNGQKRKHSDALESPQPAQNQQAIPAVQNPAPSSVQAPSVGQVQQEQQTSAETGRKRKAGVPLFGPDDIKGASMRPPLMTVRSDLVVRALHKIANQQTALNNTPHFPPYLGRVVYDPFIEPASLLDADVLRKGVGGKVEVWLDTDWLQGEVWEAGAPSHPAVSRQPSPALETAEKKASSSEGKQSTQDEQQDDAMEEDVTNDGEVATPAWTLWDLPPLRSRKIWGTDVYTDDSDILAACIHSGWLRLGSTTPLFSASKGDDSEEVSSTLHKAPRKKRKMTLPQHRSLKVTIVIAPRLIKYESSLRSGVRSRGWGNSHDGVSFAIESVELHENAPHRLSRPRRKGIEHRFGPLAKERCACSTGCETRFLHPPLQLGRLLITP